MATRRMITSAIWDDEWFGELGFFEQTLWIGLFSKCSDDQGRLKDNAILIRASVFPYKDTDTKAIMTALDCFEQAGRIIRYEVDGKLLIQLMHWWEHQRPQWAGESQWDPPPGWVDRIRTRSNNEYVTRNWTDEEYEQALLNLNSSEQILKDVPERIPERIPTGEVASNPGGQYPVPVPDPVPDPVPEKKEPPESPKAGDSDPPPNRPDQEMFKAVMTACNVVTITAKFRGSINRWIKKALADGVLPSDVRAFGRYWTSDRWRRENRPLNYKLFPTEFDIWVGQGKPARLEGTQQVLEGREYLEGEYTGFIKH